MSGLDRWNGLPQEEAAAELLAAALVSLALLVPALRRYDAHSPEAAARDSVRP